MTVLVRYVAADALRAERWAAPVLVFLAATASFNAGGGSALSCYGFTAAVLLPVALWLTVSVTNSEDPVQEAVTAVTVGSAVRVRLAKLLTAALVCAVLAAVSLVWSPVAGNPTSAGSVLAGAVAHAVTIAGGVGFGAVLSRPVVARLSRVVLGGTALPLLELALPVPPLRPMLALLGDDHPSHLALPLALLAAETAVLSAALVAAALRISRQRT